MCVFVSDLRLVCGCTRCIPRPFALLTLLMAISAETCCLIASFFSWGDPPLTFANADESASMARGCVCVCWLKLVRRKNRCATLVEVGGGRQMCVPARAPGHVGRKASGRGSSSYHAAQYQPTAASASALHR